MTVCLWSVNIMSISISHCHYHVDTSTTNNSHNNNREKQPKIQKVVFVRHGIAQHNLLDPVTGQRPNLEDPELWDPPLAYQGKQQALEAGERLKIWWRTT
jgi:hypothetical protein